MSGITRVAHWAALGAYGTVEVAQIVTYAGNGTLLRFVLNHGASFFGAWALASTLRLLLIGLSFQRIATVSSVVGAACALAIWEQTHRPDPIDYLSYGLALVVAFYFGRLDDGAAARAHKLIQRAGPLP